MVWLWISLSVLGLVFLFLLGYLVFLLIKLKPMIDHVETITNKIDSIKNTLEEAKKNFH